MLSDSDTLLTLATESWLLHSGQREKEVEQCRQSLHKHSSLKVNEIVQDLFSGLRRCLFEVLSGQETNRETTKCRSNCLGTVIFTKEVKSSFPLWLGYINFSKL